MTMKIRKAVAVITLQMTIGSSNRMVTREIKSPIASLFLARPEYM